MTELQSNVVVCYNYVKTHVANTHHTHIYPADRWFCMAEKEMEIHNDTIRQHQCIPPPLSTSPLSSHCSLPTIINAN